MGVERVDYYSEDEYQQALQQEEQQYRKQQQQQEPDVVPCFKCNKPMYQKCNEPEGNICTNCKEHEL